MTWLDGMPMDPAAITPDPVPPLKGFPFLHAGVGAVVVGPTGGGRSSLVQACAYDAARAGLRVAYLGGEITADEFNARAADLTTRRGDTLTDELRGALVNVRYLDLATTVARAWEMLDVWRREIPERFDVVILDPLAGVASTLGFDFDKSNAEFVRFYDRIVQPVTGANVAVVMLDNVGHAYEAKNRAKGASAKADKPDLTFSCSLQTSPPGLVVQAHKVRSVRASHKRGDEWIFDRDTQTITPRGDAPAADTPAFRPTVLMERVSRLLEQTPGLTRNSIRAGVKSRAQHVDLALETLIGEGFVTVNRDGQAHHHEVAKPFRQHDETPTESTESQPSPDQVPDPVTGTESQPLRSRAGTGLGDDPRTQTTESGTRSPRLVALDATPEEDEAAEDYQQRFGEAIA